MKSDLMTCTLAVASVLTAARAQDGAPAAPQRPLLDGDAFVVPIHDAADDGAAYGVWASGRDYKVSFHDGMEFHPVLGAAAPENLPLCWRATEVRVGDRPVERTERTVLRRSDWRVELRVADGVVEVYDVLPGGVEQSFVLERAPAAGADVWIRGRIDGPLRAADRALAHAPLVFADADGRPLVEYGAATGIDARGRTTPLESRFVDGAVELRVPAAWLDRAAFPVVVDPLIGRVQLDRQLVGGGVVGDTDIGFDHGNGEYLVVYSRAVSASDHDAYARMTDDALQNGDVVFTDLSATWSTPRVCCAYVIDTHRWVVAFERAFAVSGYSGIRWHLHDGGDRGLSTTFSSIAVPAGETNRYPDVGGSLMLSGQPNALIVFQADVTATQQNTASSTCWSVVIDTSGGNGTAAPRMTLGWASPGTQDRERPAVNQSAGNFDSGWAVAWQARDSTVASSEWRLWLGRVSHGGVVDLPAGSWLGSPVTGVHSERVQLAGADGRYLATYLARTGGLVINPFGVAPLLRAQRFDWDSASPSRTIVRTATIVDSPTDLIRNGGLAYDTYTDSHWTLSYETNTTHRVYAVRLGAWAGVAEQALVHDGRGSQGLASSVTFGPGVCAVAFGTDDQGNPLYVDRLGLDAADAVTYGALCGSGFASFFGVPHAGSSGFSMRLQGATPNVPAALLLGLAPAAIPLAPYGMPGCVLNVDPSSVFASVTTVTSQWGSCTLPVPLPAPIRVDAFAVWAYLAPGLNPTGVATTNGVQIMVR